MRKSGIMLGVWIASFVMLSASPAWSQYIYIINDKNFTAVTDANPPSGTFATTSDSLRIEVETLLPLPANAQNQDLEP